jgi:predicted nucleotidyltransferase
LEVCEKAMLICPYRSLGCTWNGERKDLESHVKTTCIYEKMAPYLKRQEASILNLENDHVLLREQLIELRKHIDAQFKEMKVQFHQAWMEHQNKTEEIMKIRIAELEEILYRLRSSRYSLDRCQLSRELQEPLDPKSTL